MNVTEQIGIMKFEARLANREKGEGIRNWTPEARAVSLAVRQAAGSVWGWNKRKRATAPAYTSAGYDNSMDALTEDAATVRQSLAIQAGGGKVLSARPAAYDEIAAQRLEAFKAWLAEVKRTETAIDDFNGIVAAAGGLMGVAGAKRGQSIGSVTADAAAEAAAKKVAFEKSIRRKYEKNNADYLRKNPDERGTMLDMVAEKAEYYSASPAQKVEIEKEAYRQIRDTEPSMVREEPSYVIDSAKMQFYHERNMATSPTYRAVYAEKVRETPSSTGADYKTLLEAKRSYVRERDAVRPQLQNDESAYPVGNGVWIGRLPNGDERVISVLPESGWLYNRAHSAACASSKGGECDCSCGGSNHGTSSGKPRVPPGSVIEPEVIPGATGKTPEGTCKSMADYKKFGLSAMDSDWADKAVERLEEKEKWGKKLTADEARLVKEYNAQSAQEEKDRISGKIPAAKLLESGYMTAQGPVVTYTAKDSAVKSGLSTDQGSSEDSSNWDKTVTGFKDLIAKGAKLTSANLQNQLLKDYDQKKYKLAKEALGEAWHTTSLDKFQDKFGRDPSNNFEFRTFQKSIGVPPEFIGGK